MGYGLFAPEGTILGVAFDLVARVFLAAGATATFVTCRWRMPSIARAPFNCPLYRRFRRAIAFNAFGIALHQLIGLGAQQHGEAHQFFADKASTGLLAEAQAKIKALLGL